MKDKTVLPKRCSTIFWGFILLFLACLLATVFLLPLVLQAKP
jgi:hypothetical protein